VGKASVFELGSAKVCQGFRETKIRTGGRVLLAGVNLYVRYKVRVATPDTLHSGTDSTRTNKRSVSPEFSCRYHVRFAGRPRTEPPCLKISIESQQTHKRNFAFSPWTAGTHAVHGLTAIPIFVTHLTIGFTADSSSPTIHVAIAKSMSLNY
jgi:hypothetical protein